MDRYNRLCSMPEMRQAYGVAPEDFGSDDPGVMAKAQVVCQECPLILGCFESAVSMVMQGAEIRGTWAAMSASEIKDLCTEPAGDQQEIRTNLAEVRGRLSKAQSRNHQIWQALGESAL